MNVEFTVDGDHRPLATHFFLFIKLLHNYQFLFLLCRVDPGSLIPMVHHWSLQSFCLTVLFSYNIFLSPWRC